MRHILFALLMSIALPHSLWATEVISTPGLYAFGSDVTYTSNVSNQPIIDITCDHVTLDLSGHLVNQDPTSSATGLIGILIRPGLSDIIVKNGTVGPLDGTGIVVQEDCTEITLEDLTVSDCTEGGISLIGTSEKPISDVTVKSNAVMSCGSNKSTNAIGLSATYVNALTIEASSFNRQNNGAQASIGLFLSQCQSAGITSCSCNNNSGLLQGKGVWLDQCTNCRLNECTIIQNGSTENDTSAIGYGLHTTNSTNILCIGSTIAGAFSLGGSAAGIRADECSNIGILNSICVENIGNTVAAGYLLDSSDGSAILNSIAEGTQALSGSAYGIYLNRSPECSIRGNTILKCSGARESFGIADTAQPSISVIIDNYAFNCGTNYSVQYRSPVALPVLTASLSTDPGLPSRTGGTLDNISVLP